MKKSFLPDYRRETKELIEKNNISIKTIVDSLGVSQGTAYAWKQGKKSPTRGNFERMKSLVDGTLAPAQGLYPIPAEPFLNDIPLLGEVIGGDLASSLEQADEFIKAPYKVSNHFALKVRGDSMKDAGIMAGDIVFVRIQPDANDGDVVVARCGDETTIKYLRHINGECFLVPANEKYRPIQARGCRIIGKVVKAERKY